MTPTLSDGDGPLRARDGETKLASRDADHVAADLLDAALPLPSIVPGDRPGVVWTVSSSERTCFGECDVAESGGGDDGLKALHRMIAYVRDEAVRLHIMDVAMLIEHAEDAAVASAPCMTSYGEDWDLVHEGTDSKH